MNYIKKLLNNNENIEDMNISLLIEEINQLLMIVKVIMNNIEDYIENKYNYDI